MAYPPTHPVTHVLAQLLKQDLASASFQHHTREPMFSSGRVLIGLRASLREILLQDGFIK